MGILKRSSQVDDYTVIIGCGRLGANIANTLSDNEKNVLIIDDAKEAFRKLSPSFGGLTLAGDATDLDVLEEAKLDKANAVIIVTNNDNVNIMVAQLAKEIFKVTRVVARLYNPDCECVYREFGINTICPAVLSANEISVLLRNEGRKVAI